MGKDQTKAQKQQLLLLMLIYASNACVILVLESNNNSNVTAIVLNELVHIRTCQAGKCRKHFCIDHWSPSLNMIDAHRKPSSPASDFDAVNSMSANLMCVELLHANTCSRLAAQMLVQAAAAIKASMHDDGDV